MRLSLFDSKRCHERDVIRKHDPERGNHNMKQTGILRSDLKRIFLSPIFWAAIVVSMICMALNLANFKKAILDQYIHQGTLNLFIYSAVIIGGGMLSVIAPVLPVLTFETCIWDDMESGYIRSILVRMKFSKYMLQRIVSISISGGAVFLVSMTLYWGILVFIDPSDSPMIEHGLTSMAFGSIYAYSMLLYCVFYVLLVTIFGALQALLAAGVSLLAQNRYVGLIVPAVLYHSGRIFYALSGYRFSILPWYSYSISDAKATSSAVYYDYSFYLVLCVIVFILGWKRAKRSGRL